MLYTFLPRGLVVGRAIELSVVFRATFLQPGKLTVLVKTWRNRRSESPGKMFPELVISWSLYTLRETEREKMPIKAKFHLVNMVLTVLKPGARTTNQGRWVIQLSALDSGFLNHEAGSILTGVDHHSNL